MTINQNQAVLFSVCAVIGAVGSLLVIYSPIFLVIAFLALPVGVIAAEVARAASKLERGPLTAQIGVGGTIAGATAFSFVTGAIGYALVFLVYVGIVSYIVYWRLK